MTGVSGSGKPSLVSGALVELVAASLGTQLAAEDEDKRARAPAVTPTEGRIGGDLSLVSRLVRVDQKPIGRTPRSNLATCTGLFDGVPKLFAATPAARSRHFGAGRFSFSVTGGRCETCMGEGFVSVELLFMPMVYTPCPTCRGARFNAETLAVRAGSVDSGNTVVVVEHDMRFVAASDWSSMSGRGQAKPADRSLPRVCLRRWRQMNAVRRRLTWQGKCARGNDRAATVVEFAVARHHAGGAPG